METSPSSPPPGSGSVDKAFHSTSMRTKVHIPPTDRSRAEGSYPQETGPGIPRQAG